MRPGGSSNIKRCDVDDRSKVTSPIYRARSYICTLQPSNVTLKTAANAEQQQTKTSCTNFIAPPTANNHDSSNDDGGEFGRTRYARHFLCFIYVLTTN